MVFVLPVIKELDEKDDMVLDLNTLPDGFKEFVAAVPVVKLTRDKAKDIDIARYYELKEMIEDVMRQLREDKKEIQLQMDTLKKDIIEAFQSSDRDEMQRNYIRDRFPFARKKSKGVRRALSERVRLIKGNRPPKES